MTFFNDYDFFEVGETWYTTQIEQLHVNVNEQETDLLQFEKESEIVILDIDKTTGYGTAFVIINEKYETRLSLDELYSMTMMEA